MLVTLRPTLWHAEVYVYGVGIGAGNRAMDTRLRDTGKGVVVHEARPSKARLVLPAAIGHADCMRKGQGRAPGGQSFRREVQMRQLRGSRQVYLTWLYLPI